MAWVHVQIARGTTKFDKLFLLKIIHMREIYKIRFQKPSQKPDDFRGMFNVLTAGWWKPKSPMTSYQTTRLISTNILIV